MGAFDIDGASTLSFTSRAPTGKAPRTAGKSPRKIDEGAFLSMQEENRRMKQKELATEEKVRQLTAQLARTEEAVKRILIKSDHSAKGGTAQRLLDAERELARVKADKTELESELERLKKVGSDFKRQAGDAKKRLEAALQDQRRLAQQVGRLESARSLGLGLQGPPGKPGSRPQRSVSPASARRFAQQQEELAAAREEVQALRSALREAEEHTQRHFRNLVAGLESEIVALARRVRSHEQQLSALGVPLPGPYDAGGSAHPLLAGGEGMESLPHAMLWILEEWHDNGSLYLRDPLNNGVYSFAVPSQGGASPHARSWPHPVGLFCAGALLAAPPRQALKLFLTLGEALVGQLARAQALHQPLMQAAHSLDAAAGVVEQAVQHRVDHSDVAVLLACLGTHTAAVLQPAAFANILQEICHVAAAVAAGSCRQLKAVQQKVQQALEQRAEEAVRFLMGRANTASSGALQYYNLVEWLRMLAPGLSCEEMWAALLWLRTWDLHAAGRMQPCDVLRAFQFGAVWRIGPAAGSGGVRESLQAARELGQQLGQGKEVARLEQALKEREEALGRQTMEIKVLKARLDEAESALQKALQQQQMQHQEMQQARSHQRTTSGAEELGEGGIGRLRLKYLKAKSALESVSACNSRLIKELEESKAQLAALRSSKVHLRLSPGKENSAARRSTGSPTPGPPGLGGAPCLAPGSLVVHQQLTQTQHLAARLQIELDAAESKLAIYRAHPVQRQESLPGEIKAVHPSGHNTSFAEAPGYRTERVGPKLGAMPGTKEGGKEHAAADMRGSPRQRLLASVAVHPTSLQLPEDHRDLAEHESVIELHVHEATLAPHACGPQGMTFLTLDFYEHDTQLTPVLEGTSPQYNTTAQFVVSLDDYLVDYLREGHLRVELHACQAAPAGGVDYVTTGSGKIRLAGLLEESPGAKLGYQQCELADELGRSCGMLQFALCALRPICVHPHANSLRRARQGGAAASEALLGPAGLQVQQQQGRQELAGSMRSVAEMRSAVEMRPPAQHGASMYGTAHAGADMPARGHAGSPSGSYQETTYICYTRLESPTASPAAAVKHGDSSFCHGGQPHGTPYPYAATQRAQLAIPAEQSRGAWGQQSCGMPTGQLGTASMAPPQVCQRKLRITVVGCRDLRVVHPATAQPYVSLSLVSSGAGQGRGRNTSNSSSGNSRLQRLHGDGWLHETQPGHGTNPSFSDTITVELPAAGMHGDKADASACSIEAVVFDAGVDAERDAGRGIVGLARVPLLDAGGEVGRRECYPILHPATGRHAGVIEMQLSWL